MKTLTSVRVLVVDDDEDSREMIRAALELQGASATCVADAHQALAEFKKRRPDVVVSDIGMPGADGHAFLREVRALPRRRGGHVPAVALTAYAKGDDATRVLTAGYQVHVPKPVEPAELANVVATLTGRVPTLS